eukprot:3727752-Amphidinium_carterae.3
MEVNCKEHLTNVNHMYAARSIRVQLAFTAFLFQKTSNAGASLQPPADNMRGCSGGLVEINEGCLDESNNGLQAH